MAVEYPVKASPEYPTHDQHPPKRRWWWRKRVWMPTFLLAILAAFGIIFGAVYGVKKSQTENEQIDRDRLFAAQRGTSTLQSSQASHAATTTPSGGALTTGIFVFSATPTDSSASPTASAYPPPGPSQPSGPVLQAQGHVPRDISAAADAPQLLLWDLRSESKLWRKEYGGAWEAYPDRQFLVAPITVRTSETTQTAFSVEAIHGRIVYMHFHDGQWDDWQELEFAAQFRRRPTVVSREQSKIDVINVDNDGHVWLVSYDGSLWSEWTELGADITSEVAATSWGEDRIDVFAKNGNTVLHKHWTPESGWAGEWEDLGDPFSSYYSEPGSTSSSPLAVSWHEGDGDGTIDVVINAGSSSHKLFKNGAWSDWIGMYASHEGVEFPDTQSIVKGLGVDGYPFAHLISRGTDNCIHYNGHNGTGWGSWAYLWCNDKETGSELYYPTEFLPTSMVAYESGKLELVVKDLLGDVLKLVVTGTVDPHEWSYTTGNDKWENLGQPA
ncbi:hypothetical protein BU25DRAFT_492245 [Macroventuria anomochaeta]|uniref:Uncharacterized protein n=1 Tax=Macroventuria anomochaeta TaxID=301207 RepID=A0ACB6RVQ8_9PLEO|nr:uncharacterized protein BU25DRAFT_492245 [Macroventuria anomochaeta]KAF2626090.1 hypothetical protein BU25DRAFT_492245 [Macroventuria anomochaeta]